ncbi:MAG: hypothetical protein ACR2G5_14310 [Pyrinomonadaceae bacterium]
MKRCPQCDFIYENDQRVCDMDGSELFYAPRQMLPTGSVAAKPTPQLVKSQRRRLGVRVAAALILGAVLFVAFYGFMHRIPAEDITYSSAKVIASSPAGANLVLAPPPSTLTEQASPSPTQTPQAPAKNGKVDHGTTPARPLAARFRTPTRKRQEMRSKSNHKEESKVGSFLKKTGRLLKKPFKF